MNKQTVGTALLFGFCLGSCLQFPLRKYYYVDKLVTWPDAQQYCREHYTDLATFESMDDINSLQPNISYSWAWIGLWHDPNIWKSEMGSGPNSWSWSDKSPSRFQRWRDSEPNNNGGNQHCVCENMDHKWGDERCSAMKVFICEQVVKTSTTLKMTMTSGVDLTDPAVNAQVLQQLGALLTNQGWTDFNVRWKIVSKKNKEN